MFDCIDRNEGSHPVSINGPAQWHPCFSCIARFDADRHRIEVRCRANWERIERCFETQGVGGAKSAVATRLLCTVTFFIGVNTSASSAVGSSLEHVNATE